MKNGRGSLSSSALRTIWTCPGRMDEAHPVCGFTGLRQAVTLLAWQIPLPPSAFDVLYQLNSLISAATVATSYPTSIGCLGTPSAAPTYRMSGSREASRAIHLMPSGPITASRLGLSAGCWGGIGSPVYSPVATTPGSAGIPFRSAQAKLSSIWLLMRAGPAAHTMRPSDVTHFQGTTVKSCLQPMYAWVYVWLTQ